MNLRDKGAEIWESWNRGYRTVFTLIVIGLAALLPMANTWGPTNFLQTPISSYRDVLVYPVGMFILMALGLNIVVGKSGLLDLGFVAFFAIGAYTMAIMSTSLGWNTWEVMPFGILFAMMAGAILGLPALRLRGDYLAIITLGFGEIVRIVALNLEITGGTNGIPGIPNPPSTFGLDFDIDSPESYYWAVLLLILLAIWMIRRFAVRRPGRAWEAIRQDEDVASLMGVNTLTYKLWSFVIGGAISGAAGVIFASKIMVISPQMFSFNVSILVLACVVFGGIGNIWGVMLGAAILAYLPERIRFISDARLLVFALVLIIMMNLRPDGLLPRKKREKTKESAK
jgi:branched-chain amino acid transport system permease protein